MTSELKRNVNWQFKKMYKTDWVEIIGSIFVVALIALFGFVWFRYLPIIFPGYF